MKSKYAWLSLGEALAWEPEAARRGVSTVARSRRGFLRAYQAAGTSRALPEAWKLKREGFVARHLAQAKRAGEPWFDPSGLPTRRHLALIMWGYSPDPGGLARPNPTPPAPPPWVEWAIEQARPRIEALHGAKALPSSYEVLGCGVFGCVMRTQTDGVVCKVTLDGSEAFFARAQAKLGLYLPGVCRYLEPLRVDSQAGPIWILWREQIEPPSYAQFYWDAPNFQGEDDQTFDAILRIKDKQARRAAFEKLDEDRARWQREQGTDAYEVLDELKNAGLAVSSRFAWYLANVDDRPAMFARELLGKMRQAETMFEPRKSGAYWLYAKKRVEDDHILDAALDLLAYKWHLARLAASSMTVLADALSKYLDEGLLLADVQPDNIARIGQTWTLFDAGFTIPIATRWNALWLDEKVEAGRWWSDDRWKIHQKFEELIGAPKANPIGGDRIVKILSVVDTREYEEVADGVFKPIAGSGTQNECARCKRMHEVHATVQLADGRVSVVGTGCMKGESVEVTKEVTSLANAAKRLASMNAMAGKLARELQQWDMQRRQVDKLQPPAWTEGIFSWGGRYIRMGEETMHRDALEAHKWEGSEGRPVDSGPSRPNQSELDLLIARWRNEQMKKRGAALGYRTWGILRFRDVIASELEEVRVKNALLAKAHPELAPPVVPRLYITDGGAFDKLAELEGETDPFEYSDFGSQLKKSFYLNLSAFDQLKEKGLFRPEYGEFAEVLLSDIDPRAGVILGSANVYVVMPDGEIMLDGSNAPADKVSRASAWMRVAK